MCRGDRVRDAFAKSIVALTFVAIAGCSNKTLGADVRASTAATEDSATATATARSTAATAIARLADINSIVVLGHSGATGFASDADAFARDAYENSWATGTNPQVKSVYLRLLDRNPAIKGHNYNFAKDGSKVEDLLRQATTALRLVPPPDLILIQTIDNDIHCDGTDAQNYAPFGTALSEALELINRGAPNARILLVSQWGSVANNAEVGQGIPYEVTNNSGDGPCDVFDKTGQILPDRVVYRQDVVDNYHAQLSLSCSKFANCRTDDAAMQRMVLVAGDVSSDGNHLAIQGHAKMAATAWAALNEVWLN